jgi:hypothetical protein
MPNHVHIVFGLLPHGRLGRDSVPSYRKSARRIGTNQEGTKSCVCLVADPTQMKNSRRPVYTVTEILGSLKKYTALRANRTPGRHGAFWHEESYDHVVRDDEELEHTVYYVLANPVKAGFCKNWRDWKWTYLRTCYIHE